jgi:hypothetical protein
VRHGGGSKLFPARRTGEEEEDAPVRRVSEARVAVTPVAAPARFESPSNPSVKCPLAISILLTSLASRRLRLRRRRRRLQECVECARNLGRLFEALAQDRRRFNKYAVRPCLRRPVRPRAEGSCPSVGAQSARGWRALRWPAAGSLIVPFVPRPPGPPAAAIPLRRAAGWQVHLILGYLQTLERSPGSW